jgi:hypothetical protein
MDKELTKLSASRVKTLGECSWLYWSKYHLKLPDTTNSGALRGSVCHDLFELLTKPKWIHFAKEMHDSGCDIENLPLIKRFLRAKCHKYGLEMFEEDKKSGKTNIGLIYEMIKVGLEAGFFPEKHEEIIDSEYAFDIIDEELQFRIVGFVDKILFNKETESIFISDYKSSKQQFRGEELHSNLQAMMYILAAHFLKKAGKLPDFKKVIGRFIFLRFAKNPFQELEFTEEQIEGFRHYLSYVNTIISNFDEQDAKNDYALYDNARRWKCGAKSGWKCSFRDPFSYYRLFDKNKSVIKTVLEKDYLEKFQYENIEEDCFWQKLEYAGCPAHYSNTDFN